jgi:hypothetical protein
MQLLPLLNKNNLRQGAKGLFALLIALIINYYSFTGQGWLPLATLFVMFTATGCVVYCGLLRFFFIATIIGLGSLLFSPIPLFYPRLFAVTLGAIIGILSNLIILPTPVDFEFRQALIPILQSYVNYFSAITVLLLQRNHFSAERAKIEVEKSLQKLPGWVYEPGFDVTLQKGYRYFLVKVGQMGEILFAIHHLARYAVAENLLEAIHEPLVCYVARIEQFVFALTTVLNLKKLTEGANDFSDALAEIEAKFKSTVPPALELLDVSKDYAYLTEFIYNLRDLHNVLLKLAAALR